MLRDEAVLVQPGYFFDLRIGATLVASLITPSDIFDDGIARILAAVAAI